MERPWRISASLVSKGLMGSFCTYSDITYMYMNIDTSRLLAMTNPLPTTTHTDLAAKIKKVEEEQRKKFDEDNPDWSL